MVYRVGVERKKGRRRRREVREGKQKGGRKERER